MPFDNSQGPYQPPNQSQGYAQALAQGLGFYAEQQRRDKLALNPVPPVPPVAPMPQAMPSLSTVAP